MSKILLILLSVGAFFALQKGWIKPDWNLIIKDSGLPLHAPPAQQNPKPCPTR